MCTRVSGTHSELHSQIHRSHNGNDRGRTSVLSHVIKGVHSTLGAADVDKKGSHSLPANPSFGRNMQKEAL